MDQVTKERQIRAGGNLKVLLAQMACHVRLPKNNSLNSVCGLGLNNQCPIENSSPVKLQGDS